MYFYFYVLYDRHQFLVITGLAMLWEMTVIIDISSRYKDASDFPLAFSLGSTNLTAIFPMSRNRFLTWNRRENGAGKV